MTTVVLTVAVPFAWWGAVVAISFLETPLKFRAPGISIPLGLGIGRLVFRALNALELALAVAVGIGLGTSPAASATMWTLLGLSSAILLVQASALRPALDRRAAALIAGRPRGRSRLHLGYIAGDVVKLFALPALSVAAAAAV